MAISLDGNHLDVFRGSIATLFDRSFPISTGPFHVAKTISIPTYTPAGSYKIKITLSASPGDVLACIDVQRDLGIPSAIFPLNKNLPFSSCEPIAPGGVINVAALSIQETPE